MVCSFSISKLIQLRLITCSPQSLCRFGDVDDSFSRDLVPQPLGFIRIQMHGLCLSHEVNVWSVFPVSSMYAHSRGSRLCQS
jgi:hypothetical protein